MQILNVPEVATELGVSEAQVYRLIARGHLPAVKAGNRRRVISREALDEFIRTESAVGVGVPEIATELRVSETQVYRLIQAGHLRTVDVGTRRRVLVSREALDDFIRTGGVPIAANGG